MIQFRCFVCTVEVGMNVEISPETGSRLAAEARRQGVSIDGLLRRLIEERVMFSPTTQARPRLPVWHLGSAGTYHRRDIYSDVR